MSTRAKDSLTSPISGHLRTVNLDEAPDFIALSYVWGDASQEQTFLIDGQQIKATNNLYLALRKIRAAWTSILTLSALKDSKLHPSVIGPLWIDAIPINQNDLAERTHQVQLMRDIYGKATLVLGDVCEDSEDVRVAVQAIKTVNGALERAERQSVVDWEELCPDLWEPSARQFTLNEIWDQVINLSRMPYWKRSWILQEIVLSRAATFMIGRSFFSLQPLLIFLFAMRDEYPERPPLHDLPRSGYLQEKVASARLRRETIATFIDFYLLGLSLALRPHLANAPQLLSVMLFASRLQAGDPRDSLYALLAVTSHNMTPDYTKSVQKLYTEFASAHIMDSEVAIPPRSSFNILQISGISLWATGDIRGPSWVSYWPGLALDEYLWVNELSVRSDQFLTDRNAPSTDLRIEEDDTLHLTTIIVDRIDYVAARKDPSKGNWRYLLEHVYHLLCKAGPEVTEVPEHEFPCLVRCLMLDWNREHMGRLKDDEVQTIENEVVKGLLDIAAENPDIQIPDWVQARGHRPLGNTTVQKSDQRSQGRVMFIHTAGYISSKAIRLARTTDGMFAMTPLITEIGDVICVIKNCRVPMLLWQQDDHFIIVGSCYVQGLMDGEAAAMLEKGDASVQRLKIR